MITVAKLRRKPRHLCAFTGLSVDEFDSVLAHMTAAYEAAEVARLQAGHQTTPRQRQVGAGHPFRLDLPERLLMGLMYLRLYVRQSLLGYMFDLDESNISRELHGGLLPVLLEVLPVPLRDAPLRHLADGATPDKSVRPRPRIGTLPELLAAHPEIEEVLLDATEQSVPQPKDKHKRKLAYSGKQHDHTIKTQILVLATKTQILVLATKTQILVLATKTQILVLATKTQILHVFGNLPGCLNDMLVLRASGILRQVPPGIKVRLDKGYEGTDAAYPTLDVQQPIKKKPKQPQTILERAYNFMLSVRRIVIEHHFARVKKWDCMAHLWRGLSNDHEDFFCVVAGLLNFQQSQCMHLIG